MLVLIKGFFTFFLGFIIGGYGGLAFALTNIMGRKIAAAIVSAIVIAIVAAIAVAVGFKVLFWGVLFGVFSGILCMALARVAS